MRGQSKKLKQISRKLGVGGNIRDDCLYSICCRVRNGVLLLILKFVFWYIMTALCTTPKAGCHTQVCREWEVRSGPGSSNYGWGLEILL